MYHRNILAQQSAAQNYAHALTCRRDRLTRPHWQEEPLDPQREKEAGLKLRRGVKQEQNAHRAKQAERMKSELRNHVNMHSQASRRVRC